MFLAGSPSQKLLQASFFDLVEAALSAVTKTMPELVPRWLKQLLPVVGANGLNSSVKTLFSKAASGVYNAFDIFHKVTSEESTYAGKDTWVKETPAFLASGCVDCVQAFSVTGESLKECGLDQEKFEAPRQIDC